jgi:hypothetical protein
MNSGLLCGPLGSDTMSIAVTTRTDARRLRTAAMAMRPDLTAALPACATILGGAEQFETLAPSNGSGREPWRREQPLFPGSFFAAAHGVEASVGLFFG